MYSFARRTADRLLGKYLVRNLETKSVHRSGVQRPAHARSRPVPSPGKMLAWRWHTYGGLEELKLEEARIPPLRSTDELLIRVHAASMNPLDVAMVGGYGAVALNAVRKASEFSTSHVEFPMVGGRDFVGEVVLAGPKARFPLGAVVWGAIPPHMPGSHAQYVVVKDNWVDLAPEKFGLSAAAVPYAALTAASAIRVSGLELRKGAAGGARILLIGLGGVGQMALQLLTYSGAAVTVGASPDLKSKALELGAVHFLPRDQPNYEQELVERGPWDTIIECAGLGGDFASTLKWQYNRYVTLTSPLLRETDSKGVCGGVASVATKAAMTAYNSGGRVRWAYFSTHLDSLRLLGRLAEADKLKVDVEETYEWWNGNEAYQRVKDGHLRGKILIDFTAG